MNFNTLKKELLRSGWGYAIDMVEAIEKKSSVDLDYKKTVDAWLDGESSTVSLRDEICGPFVNSSIVKYYSSRMKMPFENMWQAIDAASCAT